MSGKVVHWEIIGPDGDAIKAFYGDLFGWDFTSSPAFPGYHQVSGEQVGHSGAVGQGSEQMPSYVAMYIEVDDIEAQLAEVEAAGGKTLTPRTVFPGVVTFALFADVAGNTMGLVESATPPAG